MRARPPSALAAPDERPLAISRLGAFAAISRSIGASPNCLLQSTARRPIARALGQRHHLKPTGAKLEAPRSSSPSDTPERCRSGSTRSAETARRGQPPGTRETSPNPLYAPFINELPYSHTTIFVDEKAQRQILIDMANPRHDEKRDTKASIAEAAKADQALPIASTRSERIGQRQAKWIVGR